MPVPDRQGQACGPGRVALAVDVRLKDRASRGGLGMTKPFLGMMEGEVCAAAAQKVTARPGSIPLRRNPWPRRNCAP